MQPACGLAVVVVVGIGQRVVAAAEAAPSSRRERRRQLVASRAVGAAGRRGVHGSRLSVRRCVPRADMFLSPSPPRRAHRRRVRARRDDVGRPMRPALELRPVSSYSSMGCARSRDVHFIRHAEGTHNLAEREATRDALHKKNASWTALEAKHGVAWILTTEATGMAHYDAELTVAGARQAANLGAALQNSQQLVPLGYVGLEVDAVCSSPFRRTLQARTKFCAISPRNFRRGARPQTAHLAVPARAEDRRDRRPTAAGRARVLASDLLRERVAEYVDGRLKVSSCAPRLWQRDGRRRAGGRLRGRERGGRDVRERARGRARRGETARGRRASAEVLAQPPPPTACDAKGWAPRGGDVHGRGARRCTLAVVTHQHLLLALTATSASATSPRRRSVRQRRAPRSRCASGRRRTGARRSCRR